MIGAGIVRNFSQQIAAVKAAVLAQLAAINGASLVGFARSGGAVLRSLLSKARERWSLEDDGAVGDGVADDRAAIQSVLDALGAAGGGIVYGTPGRVYLVKHKAGATKNVGNFARSFGLEIPDNVLIDLQGATIKAEAATDYVLLSNVNTAPGIANNSRLGVVNGVIDYNQASAAGSSQALAFYGVRGLRLGDIEIRNGYNIALDLESCDQFTTGALVFRNTYGAAFYMGGASAGGGGACTKFTTGPIATYDTFNHPTNPGLPGNPALLNGTQGRIGDLRCFNSDAGVKLTAGADLQVGDVLWVGGNTQNSGFKIQGSNEGQLVQDVAVGHVEVIGAPGSGLFLTWCRGVKIKSYRGKGNATLGLDNDAVVGGDNVHIESMDSSDAGQGALLLSNSGGAYFNRSPGLTIGRMRVRNPWTVATSGTATAVNMVNGALEIDLLHITDDRAAPKLVRYFGGGGNNKEQSLSVREFRGRGAASNPDFTLTSLRKGWVGLPDVAPLNFAGGTLVLGSSAVGAGVAATSGAAIFNAADIGALIVAQDGRGVAEITAVADAQNVTVSVREAFAAGVNLAAQAWYLDRANGGAGSFSLTAGATSTTVTDYGFVNTASRGFPVIEFVPTNAAAVTLGRPIYSSVGTNALTVKHPAAVGGETYRYRVLGWTV